MTTAVVAEIEKGELDMLENPGGKLKVIVDFIVMLAITCFLLFGIALIFMAKDGMDVLIGAVVGIGGSIASYLLGLILVLFADMGDNLNYIRKASEEICEKMDTQD